MLARPQRSTRDQVSRAWLTGGSRAPPTEAGGGRTIQWYCAYRCAQLPSTIRDIGYIIISRRGSWCMHNPVCPTSGYMHNVHVAWQAAFRVCSLRLPTKSKINIYDLVYNTHSK